MASTSLHAELAAALRQRLAVIGDHDLRASDPARQLQLLQAASERITELQQRLPSPVPGELAHYLQRCSYDKALAWLEAHGAWPA
ncbi:MAG: hypothetical protein JSR82_21980 [Verrucomicrobia bacterium]|nr:hypothetical protein [Verrucomicrobiota bacterium]